MTIITGGCSHSGLESASWRDQESTINFWQLSAGSEEIDLGLLRWASQLLHFCPWNLIRTWSLVKLVRDTPDGEMVNDRLQ